MLGEFYGTRRILAEACKASYGTRRILVPFGCGNATKKPNGEKYQNNMFEDVLESPDIATLVASHSTVRVDLLDLKRGGITVTPLLRVNKNIRNRYLSLLTEPVILTTGIPGSKEFEYIIVHTPCTTSPSPCHPRRIPYRWRVRIVCEDGVRMTVSNLLTHAELWPSDRNAYPTDKQHIKDAEEALQYVHDGSTGVQDFESLLDCLDLPCSVRVFHRFYIQPLRHILSRFADAETEYARWTWRRGLRRLGMTC